MCNHLVTKYEPDMDHDHPVSYIYNGISLEVHVVGYTRLLKAAAYEKGTTLNEN